MRKNERNLLYAYLLKERQRLKDDYVKLQQTIRYRDFDSVDCIELAIAKERYLHFVEVSKTVLQLLKLEDSKGE